MLLLLFTPYPSPTGGESHGTGPRRRATRPPGPDLIDLDDDDILAALAAFSLGRSAP